MERDFSELPLREVGILRGREILQNLPDEFVIVLGIPAIVGEGARRGYRRAKEGPIQSIKVYTLGEWENLRSEAREIRRVAKSNWQKGIEIGATGVGFVVGGLTFAVIGTLAAGETAYRVTARESKALPKELKAFLGEMKAGRKEAKAGALYKAANSKRAEAAAIRRKARRSREDAEEVRTKYAKNKKFGVK